MLINVEHQLLVLVSHDFIEAMKYDCQMSCHAAEKLTVPFSCAGIIKKIVAAVTTVGSAILLLIVFALYRVYSSDKAAKQHQKRIEFFLADYKALKPARYTYADIKRITNDFKEKLGQGA